MLITNRKFSPHEACLDDQHPSLRRQTMYVFAVFLIIKYNINSDYCLCHITI